MVPFVDSLTSTLNNKSSCDIVYFDFQKAFDSVNHDLILEKLKYQYNIDGFLLRFIKNYLSNRMQGVLIDQVVSSYQPVISGVPQGSVIGPSLFVLFINDIINCVSSETTIMLYADDTKIWREINSHDDHTALQNDIHALYDWSLKNLMIFNTRRNAKLSLLNKQFFFKQFEI